MIQSIYTNSTRAILFFIVISSVFFIGLGQVHLFDWDEINFAESAREMIASGDYLRVRINYNPFWEKPPFFFWLQVLSMKLFGVSEYAARFPNALFGLMYMVSIYLIGKKHFSARFGFIWALLFFSSLLPHIYFKSGIIDPSFNYFIFLSIYFMLRVIGNDENKGTLAILSGIFSGLSVLTKGPVGFLLLGLTLLVFLIIKRFKNFPSLRSILLFFLGFIALTSIWVSAELITNGTQTLEKFIIYQAELFNSDVAGHAQPFYYHFVVVFFGCFPMSIMALPSLFKRIETPMEFARWMKVLFWVVLILFSLTTTKIIHYSSMTYIPLAFVAALSADRWIDEFRSPPKWLMVLYGSIGLFIGAALIIVPYLFAEKTTLMGMMKDPFAVDSMRVDYSFPPLVFSAGPLFIIGIVVSIVFFVRKQLLNAIVSHAIALSISLLIVLFTLLPTIESITQGPSIEMLQSIKNEDCYIDTYGFKSYAHFYYGEVKPGLRKDSKDSNWLLNGEIDKPVYFLSKSTNLELDDREDIGLVQTKGGFRLYKRLPSGKTN